MPSYAMTYLDGPYDVKQNTAGTLTLEEDDLVFTTGSFWRKEVMRLSYSDIRGIHVDTAKKMTLGRTLLIGPIFGFLFKTKEKLLKIDFRFDRTMNQAVVFRNGSRSDAETIQAKILKHRESHLERFDEDDEERETYSRRAPRKSSKSEKAPVNKSQLFGCLTIIALIIAGSYGWKWITDKKNEEITQGDRLYAEGKHEQAVARYKEHFWWAKDKPQVVKRIVEFEVSTGNIQEARKWVERALADSIQVEYDNQEAKSLLATVQKERAEKEAKEKAEMAAKAAQRERDEQARRDGIAVTSEQILREYNADKTAAERKYKGNTVRVTGPVLGVFGLDEALFIGGEIKIELDPILDVNSKHCNVYAWFSKSRRAELRFVRDGQQITIKGRCDGILGGSEICLKNCEIVK